MKFNKSGQLLLVAAASLLGATLLTACATLTVDFVFVASSKAAGATNAGEIDVMEINSESGAMRQIPTSPFPSGGRNPVAEAVSSDNTNLYVLNQDDNSIVQFIIGNDGKIYPQNTTNTAGIYPFAVAVSGTTLFVADTYQPLPTCSTAAPCSGSIAAYPISISSSSPPSDSLGQAISNGNLTYWPLSNPGSPNDVVEPTGINVLHSGSYLYVAAYDTTVGANFVFGFSVASSGALTPLNGGAPLAGGAIDTGACTSAYLNAPFIIGTCPAAIASDPSSTYVYVTDSVNNEVHAYSVASGTGLLTSLGSAVKSGDQPTAIVADPAYPYVYVANALDSTVTAYSISNGVLTWLGSNSSGGGTYETGPEPVAIGIDPSTNHFLFTANYLGSGISGNVSGFELSPTAGTLIVSKSSPYTSNALPTAVAAIPHGSSGTSTTK